MPRFYPVPQEGVSIAQFGTDANAIKIQKITLDSARNTPIEFRMAGTAIYAIAASSKLATMGVRFNDQMQDEVPFKEGQFIAGARFSSIWITNTAQPGDFITLLYAVETIDNLRIANPAAQFNDVNVLTNSTLTSLADNTVNAGTQEILSAAASTKKTTLIRNVDAANPILIGDVNVAAGVGMPLLAGEQLTLSGSFAVYAYNDTVSNIKMTVMEIHE